MTYTDWQRDNFFKAIKQLVGNNKRLGVEYDWVHLQNMEKFKKALPESTFTDIGEPTMRLRMVKSAEEIAVIKEGTLVNNLQCETMLVECLKRCMDVGKMLHVK